MKITILYATTVSLTPLFNRAVIALAPGQCNALPSDRSWPAAEKWKTIPNAIARGVQTAARKPDYRLPAKSAEDVQKAVNFARVNNIRLSIIHSGHDGLARNDAPSGLVVGMENLKGARLEASFTPTEKGMPSILSNNMGSMHVRRSVNAAQPIAVTIGAGMTTAEVNDKIAPQGVFTLGAEHGEVGVVGGWAQCGGTSPMSSVYGLGTDVVLEHQVVTADGQLKIANEKSNPDLFWALRGGCGSTYGVVVQSTIKVFPSPKFTVTKFTINATNTDGVFAPAAYMHSQFPELSEQGVQGYYMIFSKQLKGIYHTYGDKANAEYSSKVWNPILEKFKSMPNLDPGSIKAQYTDFKDYKSYFDATWGEKPKAGHKVKRMETRSESLVRRHGPGEGAMKGQILASMSMGKNVGDGRLLDKESLKNPGLAAALKAAMPSKPSGMIRGALIGGGAVFKSTAEQSSVHPSWRKSYASIWSDKDVEEIKKISPGMGAYINEASWNESNWKDTFWGSNYEKLSKIKEKYDPDIVFYVTPGINADMMEAGADGKLCRVVQPKKSVYPPMGDNTNLRKGS